MNECCTLQGLAARHLTMRGPLDADVLCPASFPRMCNPNRDMRGCTDVHVRPRRIAISVTCKPRATIAASCASCAASHGWRAATITRPWAA
jgi:hypothetical protein